MFDITNPYLCRNVHNILEEIPRSLLRVPCSGETCHHHVFVGGLFPYKVSMLQFAKAIASNIQINRSLLYSVILHDIGKTMELTGANRHRIHIERNLLVTS